MLTRGLFNWVRDRDLDALVRLLEDSEARAEALERQIKGQGALHIAAKHAWVAGVERLLRAGADVNAEDHEGQTPLHLAAEDGRGVDCTTLLRGLKQTPKQALRGRSVAFPEDHETGVAIARVLHRQGLLNKPDLPEDAWCKQTFALAGAFHEATWSDANRARLLVDLAAELDLEEHAPLLAARLACQWPFGEVCELLLGHGADLEAADQRAHTPLANAVHAGASDLVQILIERGAEVDVDDCWQGTPLQHAAEVGHQEIAKLLLDADALPIDALSGSASHGHAEIVSLLVRYGADVNEESESIESPLHAAARYGRVEIVERLLELGATPDHKNEFGEVALHLAAASHAPPPILERLAERCDVNSRDQQGCTPLHVAAAAVNAPVVETLLALGADATLVSKGGDSVLHAFFEDLDAFKIADASRLLKALIAAGADPAKANRLGQSALDFAAQWNVDWLDEALRQRR